jgi:hypothetical protein
MLLVLALVAPGPPAARAGEVKMVAGVPHVRNAAPPPGGRVECPLVELWRTGADGQTPLMGVVTEVTLDADGTVYLFDRQLAEVHVFSPAGEYLRSLGGLGAGPGEVTQPTGLVLLPDGLIGMIQGFPGQIEKLDGAGVSMGTLVPGDFAARTGGFNSLRGGQCRNGVLVLQGATMQRDGERFLRISFLGTYHPDGTPRAKIFERSSAPDFSAPTYVERDNYFFDNQNGWALGPDGRIHAATRRDQYAVEIYDADGHLLKVVTREYQPRRRTREEKERVGEGIVMVANGRRLDVAVQAEEYAPCITQLFVDCQHRLWVAHGHSGRAEPDGVFATLDLFDADGHFQKQVALRCPGDAERDRLLMMPNGQFVLLRGYRDAARSLRPGSGGGDEGDEEAAQLEIILYAAPAF